VPTDLTGVDEKIKRCNEHIEELERRIKRFDDGQAYALVEQLNPDCPEKVQGILRILKPIPPCIPTVTGDAIHNLRSALDHLVCAAVGPDNVSTNTAFPVWRSTKQPIPVPHDYRALVKGKTNGASEAFVKALNRLEPYKGGNHEALWAIDYLDITDKHRLLIDAPAAYEGITQWVAGTIGMVITPNERLTLHDGYVLWEVATDEPKKPDVAIGVAFGEPPVLGGEPLVPALTDLVEVTTGVIDELRKVL
jgi:hypothetical protein